MKIILVGEPMALFMANEPGELSEVKTFTSTLAGAEYNVAVGLARLGHQPVYCTRLGDDPFGEKILAGLRGNGISTELAATAPGELTGFMLKGSTRAGDPAIAYYRRGSAASKITPEDVDALNLTGCGWLHVTGIFPAISDTARTATHRLIDRAKENGMTVSLDPNLRPQLWPDEAAMIRTLNQLAESADLILPGLGEGNLLTGESSPEGVAGFYHELGARQVIVKTGAEGAFWSESHGRNGAVSAFPVREIVDTVGAGDGFAAGVVSALAEGFSLEQAAFRGTVIGSVQISHKSDNEGLPSRAELEAVIKEGTA